MGIQAPAKVKFNLIAELLSQGANAPCLSELCRIAGVSRSGYYRWKSTEDVRRRREERDRADFSLISEAYRYRGYAKGARGIHMRLLHQGVRMNLKKIRRLMKKYGLKCPIRGLNPYRQMAKDMKTNHVAPNVVNREFHSHSPRRVLLTDITYIRFKDCFFYLSTILDAVTHEILAYQLSSSLKVDFVIETVNRLIEEHGSVLDTTTIVHSDQGCHYTSHAFIDKLKKAEFVQSMSRRGNCWDNAPQESFYGHMKDEIKGIVSNCETFEDVRRIIDDWIDYYNRDRGQWDLFKLAPAEYYEYIQTGIYPLPLAG